MRYRKIYIRMWGDRWFRQLTPIPPCGQGLWIYLLTGDQTGIIPGIIRAGKSALAEALGWSLKAFQEAFMEISKKDKVRADWDAKLIWVPNAIIYNKPANPNVVRSWKTTWEELPECDLKDIILQELSDYMKGLGKGFQKALMEVCGKPINNPSPNQEQEQEQEQDNTSEDFKTEFADEFIGISKKYHIAVKTHFQNTSCLNTKKNFDKTVLTGAKTLEELYRLNDYSIEEITTILDWVVKEYDGSPGFHWLPNLRSLATIRKRKNANDLMKVEKIQNSMQQAGFQSARVDKKKKVACPEGHGKPVEIEERHSMACRECNRAMERVDG